MNIIKEYWQSGLATLPVNNNKSPYNIKTWKGGVTDPNLYNDAWGIAIISGKESGNIECIDFDNHFGDAKKTLTNFVKIIQDIYDKYEFVVEKTQNNGYHFVYKCEKIGGNQKLAQRARICPKTNREIPDTLIETRGDGGYFVVAPSEGYNIIRGDINNLPKITEEERDTIIEAAKSLNEYFSKRELYIAEERDDRPGDIYNQTVESRIEAIQCLKNHGWVELRGNRWRRPDKKEGISATFGVVADNVFYVFSSNAYPFDDNKAYTPFQVISLLDYDGNFGEFAKVLAERYDNDKPIKKKHSTPEVRAEKRDEDWEAIMEECTINPNIVITEPPLAVCFNELSNGYIEKRRVMTLSNFSALTGKGKAKKTFLMSMILAAAAKNGSIQNKFIGCLPDHKRMVISFDTEQSDYDAYVVAKRVEKLIGYKPSNLRFMGLRGKEPLERSGLIEYMLRRYKNDLGFVSIDGIADLMNGGDEGGEAIRIISMLMRWTKEYNTHIMTAIHQNKSDNYATGHLGSAIIKKAEVVIGVERHKTNSARSIVTCDVIRGIREFDSFEFEIHPDGLPYIDEIQGVEFKHTENYGYKETEEDVIPF